MPLFGSVAYQNRGKATRPDAPGTPSIVSQASGQVGISWTAPAFSGGAPITDYKIEYSSNSGSTWNEWSHSPTVSSSATVNGLADYQTYIFRVSAVNAVGEGNSSSNSNQAPQFTVASGGTETTVSNYNGSGQTWKIHQFTSSSTLSITRSIGDFRVLCVAGGNNGGASVAGSGSGSGGSGGKVYDESISISPNSYSVTVGGSATNSTIGAIASSASGVNGGTGGAGKGVGADQTGNPGGNGPTSNITGSTLYYSGGGGGGAVAQDGNAPAQAGGAGGNRGGGAGGVADQPPYYTGPGASGSANTGGGGGGGGISTNPGQPWVTTGGGAGGSGIVVVAYRIS